MNGDTLQAVGAVVGVLAVVLSMVGLAIGMRHNTRAQNSQNYAQALGRLAAMQSRLGADEATAEMFVRGVRDAAALSVLERVRFTWIMYEMFGTFEFMYDQAQAKALPAGLWERWAITTSWWLSYPGIEAWWAAKPAPFSSEFSAFVAECIARPIHGADASSRWGEFLQSGGMAVADTEQAEPN